ncbi:AAEL017539-PA [Aedes aegypti]|uniref:AAEL017539-PA n=2 Tax=Aedes aegypti TaxID=7159 RepID=A0A1S4G747_AEDAE|nr:cytochrome P450 6a2 [Aedes aegypti]EJY57332.1 AAEL017539-PA [Aedes aegypti]
MSALLIILALTPLFLFIIYVKQKYAYWARRNVPFLKPHFPYGNFEALDRKSIADVAREAYEEMKNRGPFYGAYFFLQPLITITDPDLIKMVLIKDFNTFPDRGLYFNERDDPLSAHMFAIEGNKWRSLRQRLSPTFTSGKMKMMFPTLAAVGDQFSAFLDEEIGSGKVVEVKDFMAKFTTDIIGSCAFGIECNSFKDPHGRFRQFGKMVFETPVHGSLVRFALKSFPEISRRLRIKALHEEASKFFYGVVEDTVKYREKNGVERKDFLSLLIDMKKDGVDFTMDEIAANSFIFFGAGFETSSSNQTFCLYELARNPECQDKARQSVLDALRNHGGMTYDAACDMQYLDQCINETLRLYPSVPVLERRAFQDYKIPGHDVVIPKGMKINIPAYAIQRDERFYPDPDVFNPDRFHQKEVAKRHICTFIPFGEGPRICIGLRFGMMQSRVGLATILSKFRISICSETANPLEYSSKTSVLIPKEGLWLRVDPL